jgi:hypothetical protein
VKEFLQAIEDHLCVFVIVAFAVTGIIAAVRGRD